ncbi:MAG: hypoxanthine phosphoribosyltransferase [Planctomycetota bacterium]
MRVLITEERIDQRVRELGAEISADYAGRPLTVLGVLTGSIILLADLIRATSVPLRVALISASSYGGTRTTPGELRINSSLVPDLRGRDVLVLDDIFDTGHTMQGLLQALKAHSPASLRTAVLLWKSARTEVSFAPDYYGFRIPDEFVVGYGLDYNDEYRQLPYIGVLNSDAGVNGQIAEA